MKDPSDREGMNTYPLPRHRCQKCGHIWIPRRDEKPAVCPECKTKHWDDRPSPGSYNTPDWYPGRRMP